MIYIIIIFFLFYFIKHYLIYPVKIGKCHLSVFYGVPGSGKTTLAACYARAYQKKGIKVYSNVDIVGCYKFDPIQDLGVWEIADGLVIIDEASICMNNRKWKEFPMHCIEYFKMHRHENTEVLVFSQDWQDFDATVKRLAYRLYIVRPSLIPFFVQAVPVKRKEGINDTTKKPDDIYSLYPWFMGPLVNHNFFAPPAWKMFNSWNRLGLPKKEFPIIQKQMKPQKVHFRRIRKLVQRVKKVCGILKRPKWLPFFLKTGKVTSKVIDTTGDTE